MYFALVRSNAQAFLRFSIFEFVKVSRRLPLLAAPALIVWLMLPMHGFSSQRKRPIKANVRFLATSTLLRSTIGLNEDSYLAEISLDGQSGPSLALLMDLYPAFAPPLTKKVLTAQNGTMIRVRRDPVCDIRYGGLLLRAAPGDLIAILPIKLVYKPDLKLTPSPDLEVPCYRTARN